MQILRPPLLSLFFFITHLTLAFNCQLKLASDFRIQTIEDVKTLLSQIESLDFVEDKKDIKIASKHLLSAPEDVQQASIPLILERLKKVVSQKDQSFGYTERRALHQLLAQVHSPKDFYQKDQSPKSFLDSYLKTRGSSYSSKDIVTLAKAFQEKLREANKKGEKLERILLGGSLTDGLARLPGSDIDFISFPRANSSSVFATKEWSEGMREKLSESASPLAKLDFEGSTVLHPGTLHQSADFTKLMIEVKEDEINLILLPREIGGVADFSLLEERIPLEP